MKTVNAMIPPSELREGNLLQGPPIEIQVLQMYRDGVVAISAYGIHQISEGISEDLQPIPINKEWLSKFAFESFQEFDMTDGHWRIGKFHVINLHGSFIVQLGLLQPEIKYIHQLQNIFFWSTGKELEVTKW